MSYSLSLQRIFWIPYGVKNSGESVWWGLRVVLKVGCEISVLQTPSCWEYVAKSYGVRVYDRAKEVGGKKYIITGR